MKWYRFKIELFAWAWRTTASVLTTLIAMKALSPYVTDTDSWVSSSTVSMSWFAYHPWAFPAFMLACVGFLWLSYFKVFSIFRADSRYGKR